MIPFDGLWEDMNEAASFCNGACYAEQDPGVHSVKHKLPYIPTSRNLDQKSIDMDARHADGFKELDVHSLYGTMMVKASHEWFKKNNKRTMIIERSAFAGLGKFGSRWLGDNWSKKEYMGASVLGTMF